MMFGSVLRQLRESKGLKQSELAEVLGITQANIARWECGIRNPSNEALLALSEFFDVTVDYLLKGA